MVYRSVFRKGTNCWDSLGKCLECVVAYFNSYKRIRMRTAVCSATIGILIDYDRPL